MKKIDLGQAITILANIGVIAGILFLAVELQQNNKLMRAEANQRFLDNRITLALHLTENDDLAAIFSRCGATCELSAVEEFKLSRYYLAAIAAWEWEYLRYQDGMLLESEIPVNQWVSLATSWPEFSRIWASTTDARNPDFLNYFESVLARAE